MKIVGNLPCFVSPGSYAERVQEAEERNATEETKVPVDLRREIFS